MQTAPKGPPSPTPEATQLHVMIVEDDSCLYHSLARALRQVNRNCQITYATNVDSALENLSHQNIDLIISDYTLCGFENGLDLWKTCRERYPHLPFVMMSGMPITQYLGLVKQEKNPPRYIPKPYSVSEIKNAVGEFL